MATVPDGTEKKDRPDNPPEEPYHMTEEILRERAKSESGGRYSTQLYAGIVASVSSISFGTVIGWSSPAIRVSIESTRAVSETHLQNTDMDIGTIASLGPLGCSLGVLVWSYFNLKIGPKRTMVLQSPLLFVTWISIALARTIEIAVFGRFLCGFLAISYKVCGETLLADTVHRVHLRHMVISFRACIYLGVLLSYVCGYTLKDKYFSILNCVIVAIHFVMLLLCPESPVYLYDVNIKQAEEALSWYRGKENIYIDMRNIKRDSEIRKVDPIAYKYMMCSKVVIKALFMIIGVNTTGVISGYYIFLYYNPAMVKKLSEDQVTTIKQAELDSKIDVISKEWDAIMLGLQLFLCSLISTWAHYNISFGIKKPLITSCVLVSTILALFAAYHFLRDEKISYVVKNNWPYTVLVHLLIISYEIGLSQCSDIMLINYLPSQVYPRAKLITRFVQWTLCFVLTRSYFFFTNEIGGAWTWTMYFILSLIALLFLSIHVVESKGKTLVKIQTEIGGNPIGSRGAAYKKRSDNTRGKSNNQIPT
ncbi:facilitated trehalose transporter Tret1-like [Onthophagus taurus]|uniref:facilitated trehalose transporter Tret1-like n=1 Tax=Onthophagus taurus TaxID=166361 RepID=UPI000C207766|nr:facilitated trehalose transporter Tret1-like [Onthophagus taurus]